MDRTPRLPDPGHGRHGPRQVAQLPSDVDPHGAARSRSRGLYRPSSACAPSLDACYRFTRKLREHHDRLTECVDAVLARLAEAHPEMGQLRSPSTARTSLPTPTGNGSCSTTARERKVFSDPDASWGHRSAIATRKGGGYYGYKVHAVVDVATELPVAWEVRTAKDSEAVRVPDLLDATRARGFDPTTAILDRGYDHTPVYVACEDRGIRPIIPLRQTPAVKAGLAKPPELRPRRVDVRRG